MSGEEVSQVEKLPCPACNGAGWTWRGRGWDRMECPVCHGSGEVEAPAPLEMPWSVVLWILALLAVVAVFIKAAQGAQ